MRITLAFICVVVGFLILSHSLGGVMSAEAATIASQLNASSSEVKTGTMGQRLGSNLGGDLLFIKVKYNSPCNDLVAGTPYRRINLYDGVTDVAYFAGFKKEDDFCLFKRIKLADSSFTDTPFTLVNGRNYTFIVSQNGPAETHTYFGSSDPNSYPDGHVVRAFAGDWVEGAGTLRDLYFELVTPIDNVAPSTTISLEGPLGENNWYLADLAVTLLAQDNEGGVGVSSTEYSLDNGSTWNSYSSPFIISTEGVHTILYRSLDLAGNLEEAKSQEVKIDKTFPEAKIYFDHLDFTLKVEGADNLSSTTVSRVNSSFTIRDDAGRRLTLGFEIKACDEPCDEEFDADLISFQYGSNPLIKPPKTELEFKWVLDGETGVLKSLQQKVEVKHQFELEAKFDLSKARTKIEKEIGEANEVKEILPGLAILKLLTKAGSLDFSY